MIKIKLFEYWATQIDWGQGRVVLVSDQAEYNWIKNYLLS